MKYLVMGTEGPGFFSPEEEAQVLEDVVLPTFKFLIDMEEEGRVVGGLPVGDRAFVFIIEAESNDDVDRLIRSMPMWGALEWEVTPLQDFTNRADAEREVLTKLNAS